MNWLTKILQRLPVGWTITFCRSEPDRVSITVVGWYPHYPRTSGERRHCMSYQQEVSIDAREIEMAELDLVQLEASKTVEYVVETIAEMRRAKDKAEGGGS